MKGTIWLTSLSSILGIAILVLLFQVRNYSIMVSRLKSENLDTKKSLTNELSKQIRYNKKYPLETLDFSVTNQEGKEIPFAAIMSGSPRLFFRITENHCNECIEKELKSIQRISDSIGKANVVFLASYTSNHALHILKRNYGIVGDIYNVAYEKLKGMDIEKLNTPYFFLGDRGGLYSFFIPEKTIPALSSIYYDNIKKVFSESKAYAIQ